MGKQKLDKAIQAYKELHPESDDTFTTTWLPFYLNPGAPKIGMSYTSLSGLIDQVMLISSLGIDKAQAYKAKFGEERVNMIFERLTQVGKESGINFKFSGKTGNTRDSHRLIQLGKKKSPALQTRVVEELFSAYFEQEGDITSHEVLTAAAVRAGLEEKEVVEWLKGENGGKEVDQEVDEAKRNQISGVPNFTLQGKYEVGGAQDPAVFLRLFEKIKAGEVSAKA